MVKRLILWAICSVLAGFTVVLVGLMSAKDAGNIAYGMIIGAVLFVILNRDLLMRGKQ